MVFSSPKESLDSQRNSTQSIASTNGTRTGFFKRLSQRRKSNASSLSMPHSQPASPPRSAPHGFENAVNRDDAIMATANGSLRPKSQPATSPWSRDKSLATSSYATLRPSLRNKTSDQSGGERSKASSKGGIKWANAFETADVQEARLRDARPTNHRSSIYSRRSQGGYFEGVDAGVGSKARRLSVDVPSELFVDECPLEDHFTVFTRMKKRKIGEGGAAAVQLMQSKTAGHPKERLFAVKEFRPWYSEEDETEAEYVRKIKSEYAIAKACEHPNIVETFRLCCSGTEWFHVMEYCDQGDLCDLIKRDYFTQDDKDCLFKQLLRGVDYLHSHGIAHRDLKSENLLLNKVGCLKIGDFGTAEVFRGRHPGLRSGFGQKDNDEDKIRLCAPGMIGSTPYMAPEVLNKSGPYDPRAVDVWSCAIVYLSLCFCGLPWEKASATDVKNFNIYLATWDEWLEAHPNERLSIATGLPKYGYAKPFRMLESMSVKVLVLGMLHPDPRKRLSAREAIECPVVKQWSCCQPNGSEQDWRCRERVALHKHLPPKESKFPKFLKPTLEVKEA